MAGRTPHEAVINYREPLQQAISCVSRAVFDVGGGYHPQAQHVLTLNEGNPVRLASDVPLAMLITQRYRIVEYEGPRGPWKVSIVAYSYVLIDSTNDQEIVAYHWHPSERRAVAFPHLHLRQGARVGRRELQKSHLPTGRISLEDFLRFLIRESGIRALRDDWEEVLDRTQAAYDAWRTWP